MHRIRYALAVLVVLLGTAPATFAAVVDLGITLDTTAKTWQATATVVPEAGDTLGLAGIEFDVIGSGGATVETATLMLPNPNDFDLGTFSSFAKGFTLFRSAPDNGQGIRASQDTPSGNVLSPLGTGNNNILEQVGLAAFTESNGDAPTTDVAFPVILATGTYTGDAGALTISSATNLITLLPSFLPDATESGAAFSTFSPDSVAGATAVIPEPGTLLVLVGAMGAVLGRRGSCLHA